MSMIDNGVQGAKRQASKRDPLLKIAHEILDPLSKREKESGRAAKYARRFQEAVAKHPDSIELTNMVFEYMWVILYNRATKKAPTAAERAASRAATARRIESHKQSIRLKIEAKAGEMVLDMVMPNGKALRECTGSDLKVMAPKIDKALTFLVRTLKPRQTVGSVYATNEELLAAAKVKHANT